MPTELDDAAQVKKLFELGNWSGYERSRADGYLDGYFVVVHFTTGVTLSFTIKLDNDIIMRVTDEDADFGQAGASASATLSLSSTPPGPTPPYQSEFGGKVNRKTQLQFDLGNNLTLLDRLKRHRTLELTGDVNTGRLSLDGSMAALNKLGTYVQTADAPIIGQAPLPPEFNPVHAMKFKNTLQG